MVLSAPAPAKGGSRVKGRDIRPVSCNSSIRRRARRTAPPPGGASPASGRRLSPVSADSRTLGVAEGAARSVAIHLEAGRQRFGVRSVLAGDADGRLSL